MFIANGVVMALSQMKVIPVTNKISQRFAQKMHRDNGLTYVYIYRKMQMNGTIILVYNISF